MRLIKPTKDRVLVDPIVPQETRTSGIVVPGKFQDAPAEGIVVEVSATLKGDDLKVGDRVFFNRFNGTDVDIRGHRYKIIEQREIEALIEQ